MYFRSGDFDDCPSDCETRFWRCSCGGKSGSGYYRKLSGKRYVHGVLSHGAWTARRGHVTDIVRLNASKFDDVGDFLLETRDSSSDLIPFTVEVSDRTVNRGNTIDVDWSLLNYGSRNYKYRVESTDPLTRRLGTSRLWIVCNPSTDAHFVMKCGTWSSATSWQDDYPAVAPSAR